MADILFSITSTLCLLIPSLTNSTFSLKLIFSINKSFIKGGNVAVTIAILPPNLLILCKPYIK